MLPDNLIDDWFESLENIQTYSNSLENPQKGLSRWGITLIPPESMNEFINVIKTKTDPNFLKEYPYEIQDLITLLEKGTSENELIIHYGI